MPARGKTKTSDRQRRIIAAGKALGKTNRQIAGEVDLHPVTVKKASHDLRTTTLIQRLKNENDQAFGKLWQDMMEKLGTDIRSEEYITRHGARNFLLKAITAGDPPLHRVGDAGGSSDGDFTLEELIISMRRYTKTA